MASDTEFSRLKMLTADGRTTNTCIYYKLTDQPICELNILL